MQGVNLLTNMGVHYYKQNVKEKLCKQITINCILFFIENIAFYISLLSCNYRKL